VKFEYSEPDTWMSKAGGKVLEILLAETLGKWLRKSLVASLRRPSTIGMV
jgi:hypothetical protein